MFHEVLDLKVKNCPRCTRLLCDDAFYLNASKPDGHDAYCKTCVYEMNAGKKESGESSKDNEIFREDATV